MCEFCIDSKHKGHNVSDLKSSAQKFREKLEEINAKNLKVFEMMKEDLKFW